jgi:hypothetical protein
MTKRLQFEFLLWAIGCLVAAQGAWGQGAHPDRPPQHQQAQAPKANQNRPPAPQQNPQQNQNRSPAPQPNQSQRHPDTIGPARSFQPSEHGERPDANPAARLTPRQQVGVGAPRPFVDRMRDLTPQQRDRVLQNSRAFQNLAPEQQNRIRNQFAQWDRMTPSQRADLREKENTWRNLTPEQREHIKNDVLPQWRQMPWGRQQAVQQKLAILQNMPESARNRRLADPNFTRGMSDEDKAMLHGLSHLHVGGAPDPPGNEP